MAILCTFSKGSMCSVPRSCIGFRIFNTLYSHCCQAKCYFNIDFASNNWKKYALFNRICTAGSRDFSYTKSKPNIYHFPLLENHSIQSEINLWIPEVYVAKISPKTIFMTKSLSKKTNHLVYFVKFFVTFSEYMYFSYDFKKQGKTAEMVVIW
jgi:hypothetical protein